MAAQDYDLKTLLDVARWEPVQDQLAALTRTAIITIDYKGIPISKHSMRTAFCIDERTIPSFCHSVSVPIYAIGRSRCSWRSSIHLITGTTDCMNEWSFMRCSP